MSAIERMFVETHFARVARTVVFDRAQRSLILGSLLGDGTLLATTAGFSFRVHHSLSQRALVDWKFRILAPVVRTPPRQSGKGVYFRTVTHPAMSEYRAEFYDGTRKIVPYRLLERELDALALAVWIMDDGSAERGQLRINTQCFSREEVETLARIIQAKFGVETRVNSDKKAFRLRCVAASMNRLVSLVWGHTIPEMRYKLARQLVSACAGPSRTREHSGGARTTGG